MGNDNTKTIMVNILVTNFVITVCQKWCKAFSCVIYLNDITILR